MVDTQRFAIWHPPGMSENSASKKPAIIPTQAPPSKFPRNIGQILKEYNWTEDGGPSSPNPRMTPTHHVQPPPYRKLSRPPPPPPPPPQQLAEEEEEDSTEEESSSEEERIPPVALGKAKAPKPVSPSVATRAPNVKQSPDTPINTQERYHFSKPIEPTKRTESRPVPFPIQSTSVKISPSPDPTSLKNRVGTPQMGQSPDHQPMKPNRSEPMIPAASKAVQAKVTTGWRERINSMTPVPPKIPPAKMEPPRQERTNPILQPTPKPTPSRTDHSRSGSLDIGVFANSSIGAMNAFLIELEESAFDSLKLSMMEVSIRQFHLIAADADIELTRQLMSTKVPTTNESRSKLIEKHKVYLETQAHTVLDEMQEYNEQVWEKCYKTRMEERVDQPRPPVAMQVPPEPEPEPEEQEPESEPEPEPEPSPITAETPDRAPVAAEKAPEFWRPTMTDDSEPPTPKMAMDEIFQRVHANLEEEQHGEGSVASPTTVKTEKKATADSARSQSISNAKVKGAAIAKSKPQLKQTRQVTMEEIPEKPLERPVDKSRSVLGEKQTPPPWPANTTVTTDTKSTTKATTKGKTAKETRAEKNRKGKNKVADTQPMSDPLEMAIDNMVSTGKVESMLEQMTSAWR